ncbi:MAG: 16S rRNA (uracil(1498)-N(3))-methyltransferase [Gammaproteobacteria bacterium]|jgi:16S rRNA (uracil1498-N3)-methyltransferase|nr:16S rRNA (uracil(1498)-N(3))-methyltransferase [Gammaproteobacteria bacterium]MBT4493902.1 16S rRNA (uracil(1498)-N(3))-methyltransferase [Gammaproteobacteria bacterium]MBT7372117.1 16S rRNA (uracil(1498)-N(3))-methyltransferase [Gammaproteobacteria bacterium]
MTSLPRFHVTGGITTGTIFNLPPDAVHHLIHVLRLAVGDEVIIFNGAGGEHHCRIESISKKTASLFPEQFSPVNRNSDLHIHLGLCILKKDAMDRALTKSVELGVTAITPLISEHSTVARKIIYDRISHWQQVVISACEQCGLNIPPHLHEPAQLSDWISQTESDLKLVATQFGESLPTERSSQNSVCLLVGPEGGFSDDETDSASNAGFISVKFGNRILRAETAPLVAISVIQHLWGDH